LIESDSSSNDREYATSFTHLRGVVPFFYRGHCQSLINEIARPHAFYIINAALGPSSGENLIDMKRLLLFLGLILSYSFANGQIVYEPHLPKKSPTTVWHNMLIQSISTNPKRSWDDGTKYKGEDLANGMGACLWDSGSIYFGSYFENVRDGYGIYFEGRDGYSISYCPDAKYYVGEWSKGKKSGTGTCYDASGKLIYHGEFKDDKPQDTYPTKDIYSSYKFECIDLDGGNMYIGETKGGKMNGYGIFAWNNGDLWHGWWKDGLRDGRGIFIWNNGLSQTGIWKGDAHNPFSTVEQREEKNISVEIDKAWLVENVNRDGKSGMGIHIKFTVEGMLNKQGRCVAWFYFSHGNILARETGQYRTSSGHLSVAEQITPGYENALYEDFELFIPYKEFPYLGKGKHDLKVCVGIFNGSELLATSDFLNFSLTWQ